MAGMFYSLQEAAEKLNKSEEEVRELAKEGKLREFRDGSSLLFKMDEVEALMAETGVVASEEKAALLEQPPEPIEINESEQVPEPEQLPEMEEAETPEPMAEPEQVLESEEVEQLPELEEAQSQEPLAEQEQLPDLEEAEDAKLAEEPEGTTELGHMPDIGEAEGTELAVETTDTTESEQMPEMAGSEETGLLAESEDTAEEDISLAPEAGDTEITSAGGEFASADTALTGEGINVLGETDRDYEITDDTMAETFGPLGTADEASLEEIEEDVNLDTFGSGSGLLDLSLQADDTSLGGILDEIYTTEEGQEPAEPGSAAGMEEEAEPMLHEEDEMVGPQPIPEMAIARKYVEPEPDVQSNTLGMLLFLPLLAVIYTAAVTVAAQRGVMPSILESVQGVIWYVTAGAIVVAGLIVGASFMLSGDFAAKTKKQKKPKKPKKPKKSKKSKRGKKGKDETPPPAPEEQEEELAEELGDIELGGEDTAL